MTLRVKPNPTYYSIGEWLMDLSMTSLAGTTLANIHGLEYWLMGAGALGRLLMKIYGVKQPAL